MGIATNPYGKKLPNKHSSGSDDTNDPKKKLKNGLCGCSRVCMCCLVGPLIFILTAIVITIVLVTGNIFGDSDPIGPDWSALEDSKYTWTGPTL